MIPNDWRKFARFDDSGMVLDTSVDIRAKVFGLSVSPVYGPRCDYFKSHFQYEKWPKEFDLSVNSDWKDLGDGFGLHFREFEKDSGGRYHSYELRYQFQGKGIALCFFVFTRTERVGFALLKHFVELTGSGCRLFDPVFYFRIFEYLTIRFTKVQRVDLCCDFPLEAVKFLPAAHRSCLAKGQTSNLKAHRGEPETLYIGEERESVNTYRLIRIYDKVKETIARKKDLLFEIGKPRLRFEVELRVDKCLKFVPTWIVDPLKLCDIWRFEFREVLDLPKESVRNFLSCEAMTKPRVIHWDDSDKDNRISREKGCLASYLVAAYKRGVSRERIFQFAEDIYQEWLLNPEWKRAHVVRRKRRSTAP